MTLNHNFVETTMENQVSTSGNKRSMPATLMQNLIYPAFLGAFLVSFSLESAVSTFFQMLLALFLLIYLATGYAQTELGIAGKNYPYEWPDFVFDAFELAIMSIAFVVLKISKLDLGSLFSFVDPGSPRQLWFFIFFLFATPLLRRSYGMVKAAIYDTLCVVAMLMCMAATSIDAFNIDSCHTEMFFGNNFDRFMIFALIILLAVYIWALTDEENNPRILDTWYRESISCRIKSWPGPVCAALLIIHIILYSTGIGS